MKQPAGLIAAVVMITTPASAQHAMNMGGPFIGTAAGVPLHVTLVSGQPYEAVPAEAVEVWVWTIFKDPQGFCGSKCNTSATLMTMDCQTREVWYGTNERYMDGEFVESTESTLGSEIAVPEGIMGMTLDAICDPYYSTPLTFEDYASARAGVLKFLAENE